VFPIYFFLTLASRIFVNSFTTTTLPSSYYCNDIVKPSSTRRNDLQSGVGWQSSVSRQKYFDNAIEELIRNVELQLDDTTIKQQYQAVAFLFVSQFHTYNFADIVHKVYEGLDQKVMLLSLIGAGVIGENEEFDESTPVISMLWGVVPPGAKAYSYFDGPKQSMAALFPPPSLASSGRQNSRIVFADPWFDVEESILSNSGRNDIVIGGISCPSAFADEFRPTVAINGTALPQGSAVGISFTGSFGIQAIVAQGCRPVGPVFTITSAEGNTLREIDGVLALIQLERVASKASIHDILLMDRNGLLCGISEKKKNNSNNDGTTSATTTTTSSMNNKDPPNDVMIRQIEGMQELQVNSTGLGGGALTLNVKALREGDQFQFYVRDGDAAQEDMEDKMRRAKVERLFEGQSAGMPVAAIQITCLSRSRSFFGSPNVNLKLIQQELLGKIDDKVAIPVGGFFAKGEIGPSIPSVTGGTTTDIHTFTTVVGLLCDYSSATTSDETLSGGEPLIEIASEKEWG